MKMSDELAYSIRHTYEHARMHRCTCMQTDTDGRGVPWHAIVLSAETRPFFTSCYHLGV